MHIHATYTLSREMARARKRRRSDNDNEATEGDANDVSEGQAQHRTPMSIPTPETAAPPRAASRRDEEEEEEEPRVISSMAEFSEQVGVWMCTYKMRTYRENNHPSAIRATDHYARACMYDGCNVWIHTQVYDLLLYGAVDREDDEEDCAGGIPRGRVTTYGCVAERLGSRKCARHVGWALNALKQSNGGEEGSVPWWRVVNSRGEVSFRASDKDAHGRSLQAMRLEREGVVFEELTGGARRIVDFEKLLWKWRR